MCSHIQKCEWIVESVSLQKFGLYIIILPLYYKFYKEILYKPKDLFMVCVHTGKKCEWIVGSTNFQTIVHIQSLCLQNKIFCLYIILPIITQLFSPLFTLKQPFYSHQSLSKPEIARIGMTKVQIEVQQQIFEHVGPRVQHLYAGQLRSRPLWTWQNHVTRIGENKIHHACETHKTTSRVSTTWHKLLSQKFCWY